MKYDTWQKQVLKTKGNLCLCSGRQVGKSTIISEDAGEYAMKNPKKVIMIIASVDRQSLLLFEKVLSYIIMKAGKGVLMKGKDRPTKHRLNLKNGSIIHCLPTGDSGYGIRGFTIDRLYADEAAFIKEEVWAAVTPMLATTGGDIVLLSTPFGTDGYFYRCFHDKKFTQIHVNTEEVAEKREEPQRTQMLQFLEDEKLRMTRMQYQQEYLGEFVGGIQRFITDELIQAICTGNGQYKPLGDKFQGIDIARMGGDEIVLASLDRIQRKRLIQFDLTIPEPQKLTDTVRLILHKDRTINHKGIYLDDGGMGVGVLDPLLEDPQTKRKVEGLNNAKRIISYEIDGKVSKKKLLGVDMSVFLKVLMEKGQIELFNDPRVIQSLRSMQCDVSEGTLRIYGNYSHIWEALKRAAYCMKDKSLNPYIY